MTDQNRTPDGMLDALTVAVIAAYWRALVDVFGHPDNPEPKPRRS